MSTEQIPAEAVEAAARALRDNGSFRPCDRGCECEDDVADSRAVAEAMITAALPHLATHHPARVLPSVEDVRALDELPIGSVVRTAAGDTWVCYESLVRPRWVGIEPDSDDYEVTVEHKQHWLYDALPLTVLYRPDDAAPTVQQVRAEALREAASALENYSADSPTPRFDAMVSDWLRARAAETEGDRG